MGGGRPGRPGQRLSEDGDEILVPWSRDGVRQSDGASQTPTRSAQGGPFVPEHRGRAVRLAQLRANLATVSGTPGDGRVLPTRPAQAAPRWRASPGAADGR